MISIAHAAAADVARTFVGQINDIILFPLIILMTAVAVMIFIWGGLQYVLKANDPAGRAQGAKHLLWGVVGLLVMVSAYAILTIAANTFDIDVDKSAEGIFSGDAVIDTDAFTSSPGSSPTSATRPAARQQTPSGDSTTQALEDELTASIGDNEIKYNDWFTGITGGSLEGRTRAINLAFEYELISSNLRTQLLDELSRE